MRERDKNNPKILFYRVLHKISAFAIKLKLCSSCMMISWSIKLFTIMREKLMTFSTMYVYTARQDILVPSDNVIENNNDVEFPQAQARLFSLHS
jgi:hypothetical protein